jgi:hypothetical protein
VTSAAAVRANEKQTVKYVGLMSRTVAEAVDVDEDRVQRLAALAPPRLAQADAVISTKKSPQ